jgi:hypothetical protein
MSGTTGAYSKSGSSVAYEGQNNHATQGMFWGNKRTDEFQLLELEREDRIGGLSDP